MRGPIEAMEERLRQLASAPSMPTLMMWGDRKRIAGEMLAALTDAGLAVVPAVLTPRAQEMAVSRILEDRLLMSSMRRASKTSIPGLEATRQVAVRVATHVSDARIDDLAARIRAAQRPPTESNG